MQYSIDYQDNLSRTLMFEAVEIFPLNIAPSLSSQPSFEDWYNMVIDQHQNSTTLDLREWDNCFGNMYAGCTSTYPKFWSYITQVIHTETQVFKVNVCLSVALINTTIDILPPLSFSLKWGILKAKLLGDFLTDFACFLLLRATFTASTLHRQNGMSCRQYITRCV